jgi:hypothetical protein
MQVRILSYGKLTPRAKTGYNPDVHRIYFTKSLPS